VARVMITEKVYTMTPLTSPLNSPAGHAAARPDRAAARTPGVTVAITASSKNAPPSACSAELLTLAGPPHQISADHIAPASAPHRSPVWAPAVGRRSTRRAQAA
jgi:hypothetical protein